MVLGNTHANPFRDCNAVHHCQEHIKLTTTIKLHKIRCQVAPRKEPGFRIGVNQSISSCWEQNQSVTVEGFLEDSTVSSPLGWASTSLQFLTSFSTDIRVYGLSPLNQFISTQCLDPTLPLTLFLQKGSYQINKHGKALELENRQKLEEFRGHERKCLYFFHYTVNIKDGSGTSSDGAEGNENTVEKRLYYIAI